MIEGSEGEALLSACVTMLQHFQAYHTSAVHSHAAVAATADDYLVPISEVYCRLASLVNPSKTLESLLTDCVSSLSCPVGGGNAPFLPVVSSFILSRVPSVFTDNCDHDKVTVAAVRNLFCKLFVPLCNIVGDIVKSGGGQRGHTSVTVSVIGAVKNLHKCLVNFFPSEVGLLKVASTQMLSVVINLLSEAVRGDDDASVVGAIAELLDVLVDKSRVESEGSVLAEFVKAFDGIGGGDAAQRRFIYTPYTSLVQLVESSGSSKATKALSDLSSLIITLVTKCIPIICVKAGPCITTALVTPFLTQQVQRSPLHTVRCNTLNVYLDIQDIPTIDRLPMYEKSLYKEVCNVLLNLSTFPPGFESWEEEFNVDQSEFQEFRQLVSEPLQQCYALLRLDFLRTLQAYMSSSSKWEEIEACLFALEEVSGVVCARVKSMAGGGDLKADKEGTVQVLKELTDSVCKAHGVQLHPCMLTSTCRYLGNFAPFINSYCPPQTIIQILEYLKVALEQKGSSTETKVEAGKSVRGVLLNCTKQLSGTDITTSLLGSMISTALETGCHQAILAVAEGGTRLCVQIGGQKCIEGLGSLCNPILKFIEGCFVEMKNLEGSGGDLGRVESLKRSTAMGLSVLAVIIKYLDGTTSEGSGVYHPLLNALWPMVQSLSSYPPCRSHSDILESLLSVYSKIVASFGEMVEGKLGEIINVVVGAYEESYASCCLGFVGVAVEKFGRRGGGVEESFRALLGHLTTKTCQRIQSVGFTSATGLITSFFSLCQIFLLFSPLGLVRNEQFHLIYELSVACLSQCKGDRDSTRQSLIFLTQIIGRNLVRLGQTTSKALESCSDIIDSHTARHGPEIVKQCMLGLSGSSPSSLAPAMSECLHAIVCHLVGPATATATNAVPIPNGRNLVSSWIFSSLSSPTIPTFLSSQDKDTLLIAMVHLGQDPQGKHKFKMLCSDFYKVCKKEMNGEVFKTYIV